MGRVRLSISGAVRARVLVALGGVTNAVGLWLVCGLGFALLFGGVTMALYGLWLVDVDGPDEPKGVRR